MDYDFISRKEPLTPEELAQLQAEAEAERKAAGLNPLNFLLRKYGQPNQEQEQKERENNV